MQFFRKLVCQYFLFNKFRDGISSGTVLSAPDTECKIRDGVFICCQPLLIRVTNGIVSVPVLPAFALQRQRWHLYCQHFLTRVRSDIIIVSILSLFSAFAYHSQKWHLYFQHLFIRVRSGIFIVSICLSKSEVASLLSAFPYQSQMWHLYFVSICLSESELASLLSAFAGQSQKWGLSCQHSLCRVRHSVFVVSICCLKS